LSLTIAKILATGLDEEYKKPKGLADQIVRMLDDDGVRPTDRLRVLMLYLIFKDGLLPADTQKLLQHAQLPAQDGEVIRNMDLLGARTTRGLKDPRPAPGPLFPRKPVPANLQDEYSLSRYETVLQNLLEAHGNNTLDATLFPYTKPPLDIGDDPTMAANPAAAAASLRTTAKPTWARNNRAANSNSASETRQRVIVFMAGGATYSESRACSVVGRGSSGPSSAGYQQQQQREIYLVSSHMLTPLLFIRQLADLSTDRRRLNIPADLPKPVAPKHLFEPDPQPKPVAPPSQQQAPARPHHAPPTQAMNQMNINSAGPSANSSAKLSKEPAAEKEKKRKGLLGFGKSKS
jgi:syntaxin-binding protein 1